MSTMQIFNAQTQAVEDAEMTVDANNEIVGTFADGSIVKFPAGLTKEQFDALIAMHEEANTGQEIITPEMEAEMAAQRAASLELIGETEENGNPMPESDQSNDPTNDQPAS